jgi:hypothetical protein
VPLAGFFSFQQKPAKGTTLQHSPACSHIPDKFAFIRG